jgi:D-xylose transport system ATP-binding protein
MEREAIGLLRRLSVRLDDVRRPVAALSGGQRQSVAIARALLGNPRLVILDEPTAALGVSQTEQVLGLIRTLRAQGHAVVLISHNIDDVLAVADRVSVLRLGRNNGEFTAAETDHQRVVAAITGAVRVPADQTSEEVTSP